MPEPTVVKVTADLSVMKQEFASGTAEFKRWAQNINAGNATAMKAFRETADELRQLGKDARVSSEDMDKLNRTIGTVENAATRAGMRTADAFERGARGLSVMSKQGGVTARSMNQIIAAAGDIAFAFGPEGAIISGVLMVTAGIIAHFESVEQKMEDTVRSFNAHMTEMLLNDSPIEAARAAGRAYVQELQAIEQMKRDSARVAAADGNMNVLQNLGALPAWFRTQFGGDQQAIDKAGAEVGGATRAADIMRAVHAHDKEIDRLKSDEKQARQELTTWQEKVDALRTQGKTRELQVAEAQVTEQHQRMMTLRARVTQLEQERTGTANRFATDATLDPATRYALTHPSTPREVTDFSDEDHRSDAATSSKRAEQRIQQMQRAAAAEKQVRDARLRDATRATALLTQMQDTAAEHELLSDNQREAAGKAHAQRDYDRRLSEIESLHVTEAMKTQLLVAAARERDAAVAQVERTAYERQQRDLFHVMNERIAQTQKEAKAQERAEQEKQRTLTSILASSGDELVRGHGDLAHRIMQAALEPEVKYLEAMAQKHYALAAKDALTGNFVGAAEQFAGAAALMAGASIVGSFAGGGGGGGGGGSAGGGGGMSSASQMGANGSGNTQPLAVHVIVVHQDTTGREISRTRAEIQRAEDRNVPIRVGGLG